MGLTQGRFVANGIAQKIPGAYCGQLGKPFHESLGLCAFANARRTDENNASGAFELLSGHSDGMRSGSAFERGNPGFEKLLVGSRRSSKLQRLIYYSLMLKIIRDVYICTDRCCRRRAQSSALGRRCVGSKSKSAKTFWAIAVGLL